MPTRSLTYYVGALFSRRVHKQSFRLGLWRGKSKPDDRFANGWRDVSPFRRFLCRSDHSHSFADVVADVYNSGSRRRAFEHGYCAVKLRIGLRVAVQPPSDEQLRRRLDRSNLPALTDDSVLPVGACGVRVSVPLPSAETLATLAGDFGFSAKFVRKHGLVRWHRRTDEQTWHRCDIDVTDRYIATLNVDCCVSSGSTCVHCIVRCQGCGAHRSASTLFDHAHKIDTGCPLSRIAQIG